MSVRIGGVLLGVLVVVPVAVGVWVRVGAAVGRAGERSLATKASYEPPRLAGWSGPEAGKSIEAVRPAAPASADLPCREKAPTDQGPCLPDRVALHSISGIRPASARRTIGTSEHPGSTMHRTMPPIPRLM